VRLTIFVAAIGIFLIADQVRTGGHYRREAWSTISSATCRVLPGC
jgi:hypothetical protein